MYEKTIIYMHTHMYICIYVCMYPYPKGKQTKWGSDLIILKECFISNTSFCIVHKDHILEVYFNPSSVPGRITGRLNQELIGYISLSCLELASLFWSV